VPILEKWARKKASELYKRAKKPNRCSKYSYALSFITFLYRGTMNPIKKTSVIGTINPCTSLIQFDEYPSPGYARKVILLISVAKIDIPTAQAGKEPPALKKLLMLFCFLENRRLMKRGTNSDRLMII
jgi:hypothetical protein